jgi:hypothetical protein
MVDPLDVTVWQQGASVGHGAANATTTSERRVLRRAEPTDGFDRDHSLAVIVKEGVMVGEGNAVNTTPIRRPRQCRRPQRRTPIGWRNSRCESRMRPCPMRGGCLLGRGIYHGAAIIALAPRAIRDDRRR